MEQGREADADHEIFQTLTAGLPEGENPELTRRLLLVDTHIDVPYRLHKAWEDVSVATEGGDFDYPRAVAGGLDSMFMSIYIPADVDAAGEAKGFAEGLIDFNNPEKFHIITKLIY